MRRSPLWVLGKVVFNAFILNYAASSFIVSTGLPCPALQHL